MNTKLYKKKWIAAFALAGAVSLAASCQTMSMGGVEQVSLTGANEVPPVTTSASGSGTAPFGSATCTGWRCPTPRSMPS